MRAIITKPSAALLDDSDPQDRHFVTALARGLQILQYLGQAPRPLTVSQIAKEIGLPQPTVWRLCHTMIKLGFLEKTDEDRLRPGLPLLGLGYASLSQVPLADLARTGMAEIARQFPGAVSLGIRQEFDMLYVQRIEGGSIIFSGLRTGSRVSLMASAMGWGYMAGLPNADRNALLLRARQQIPDEFARVIHPLKAALARYAAKGFVLNTGLLHPEINAIGIPVGKIGREPTACLSFGGARSIFTADVLENEVAPELYKLAKNLSVSV